jgi:hypothetical protein
MRCLVFIILLAPLGALAQHWDWVQMIAGGGNNVVWDMTHDSQDNIICTGRCKLSVTFGFPNGIPVTAYGSQTDAYVFKITPQGDTLWARKMGYVDPDWGRGITVDSDDNIYVTGDFVNMAIFGSDTIYGYNNGSTNPNSQARSGFIAKYDPDGNLVWVNKFQGGDRVRPYSISLDSQNNAYVAGHMMGLTTFDSFTIGEANTTTFGFFAKYDPTGTCVWARYVDAPTGSEAMDIKVLDDNRIAITGFYKTQFQYDGHLFPGGSTVWGNFFMMQVDSMNNYIWNTTWTGPFLIQGNEMAIDSDKNTYVVGNFAYSMTNGSITIQSLGSGSTTSEYIDNRNSFVAKYDIDGNLLWVNRIGTQMLTQFDAIALLDDSKVVIGGYTADTIFMDNPVDTIIAANGVPSTVIIAYDQDGQHIWNKQIISSGVNPDNAVKAITCDSEKNLYCGGWFDQVGTWDDVSKTASNGYDAYIAKLFPPLEPQVEGTDTVCQGETILLESFRYGGPVTYSWLTQDAVTITAYEDSIWLQFPLDGVDTIRYIVSNGHETDTAIHIIHVLPMPVVDLGPDQAICDGAIVTFDAGGANYFYDWGAGFVLNDSLLAANATATISITVKDIFGCENSDQVEVLVNPLPVVELGPDTLLCTGETIALIAGPISLSYDWGSGFTPGDNSLVITGPGTYVVQVMDGNGCVAVDSINCLYSTSLPVDLGPDQVLCDGTSLLLVAGETGYSYDWGSGFVFNDSTLMVSVAGQYSVVVESMSGCTGTDTIQLTYGALPVVDLGPDMTDCEGSNITLDAGSAGFSYNWGSGFIPDDSSLVVTSSGAYFVNVQNLSGCSNSDSVNVYFNPLPNVDLGPDDIVCTGDSLILVAGTSADSYDWGSGFIVGDSSLTVYTGGVYSVTVMNSWGCTNSDNILVTASGCLGVPENEIMQVVVVPNPFVNNIVIQFNTDNFTQVDLLVFSVTGEVVARFNKVTSDEPLDLSGLNAGVYYCVLSDSGNYSERVKVIKLN